MAAGSHRLAPDDRRQAILDIAREVFLTEGYADTSMSSIAARLGGSKGTLYNYFPSKEALFVAFMRQECEVEAEIAHAMDHPDDDLGKALNHLGCKLINFLLSDKIQAVHRLVIAESQRFPELGRTFYAEGPRRGISRLAEVFQRWMDEGRIRKVEAAQAAEQFIDLCKSGLYQRRLWNVAVPTATDIEANVERATAVFMAYYVL
jgi:TetR/AcrR family transcriptional regulator, mexJK operon transcriptional repressor